MSSEMTVGSIVRLKSGGPNMTVNGTNDKVAACTWFDNAEVKTGTFDMQALIPMNEN